MTASSMIPSKSPSGRCQLEAAPWDGPSEPYSLKLPPPLVFFRRVVMEVTPFPWIVCMSLLRALLVIHGKLMEI